MSVISSINPLYSLSGLFVGLLVGQTGVGGGSLMTPLLILLFGVHPTTAVGTDLLFAAITKSTGTLVHGLNKTVNWPVTGTLAMGSLPATGVTLFLADHVDMAAGAKSVMVSTILGVALILTAISLMFRKQVLMLAGNRLDELNSVRVKWADRVYWRDPRRAGVAVLRRRGRARRDGADLPLSPPPDRPDCGIGHRTCGPADPLRRDRTLVHRFG